MKVFGQIANIIKTIIGNQSFDNIVATPNINTGKTLLHVAIEYQLDETILLALTTTTTSKEQSQTQIALTTPDKAGRIPLHYVAAMAAAKPGSKLTKFSSLTQSTKPENDETYKLSSLSLNFL